MENRLVYRKIDTFDTPAVTENVKSVRKSDFEKKVKDEYGKLLNELQALKVANLSSGTLEDLWNRLTDFNNNSLSLSKINSIRFLSSELHEKLAKKIMDYLKKNNKKFRLFGTDKSVESGDIGLNDISREFLFMIIFLGNPEQNFYDMVSADNGKWDYNKVRSVSELVLLAGDRFQTVIGAEKVRMMFSDLLRKFDFKSSRKNLSSLPASFDKEEGSLKSSNDYEKLSAALKFYASYFYPAVEYPSVFSAGETKAQELYNKEYGLFFYAGMDGDFKSVDKAVDDLLDYMNSERINEVFKAVPRYTGSNFPKLSDNELAVYSNNRALVALSFYSQIIDGLASNTSISPSDKGKILNKYFNFKKGLSSVFPGNGSEKDSLADVSDDVSKGVSDKAVGGVSTLKSGSKPDLSSNTVTSKTDVGNADDVSEDDGGEGSIFFDSVDDDNRSFELPESMVKQLDYLELVKALADGMGISNVVTQILNVKEEVVVYYNEKYDGVTPFNLDFAVLSKPDLAVFISSFIKFLGVSPFGGGDARGEDANTFVNSSGYPEYIKSLLREHGVPGSNKLLDTDDIMDLLSKVPFRDTFVGVLKRGVLDAGSVKESTACIAIFLRTICKNFAASRDLEYKVLDLKMAKAREKAREETKKEESVKDSAKYNLRETARGQALSSVLRILKIENNREALLAILRERVLAEDFEMRKKIDSLQRGRYSMAPLLPDDVQKMAKKLYGKAVDALVASTEEGIYNALLDKRALRYVDVGGLNVAEKVAFNDLRGSLGVDTMSDETKDFVSTLGGVVADVALCFVGIGAGFVAGRLARGVFLAVDRYVKAKKLFGALNTIVRTALRVGYYVGRLASESFAFLQTYPWLQQYFGIKGAEKTLVQIFNENSWEAVKKLAGTMALFGAFHGFLSINNFLKNGANLNALGSLAESSAVSATVRKEASVVYHRFLKASGKSPQETIKVLTEVLAQKTLPNEVRALLPNPAEVEKIDQLRQHYARFIEMVKDPALKKLLGVALQDLSFDFLAIVVGTIGKEQIEDGKVKMFENFKAGTLVEIYLKAAIFRGSFSAVTAGMRRSAEWFKGKFAGSIFELPNIVLNAINERSKFSSQLNDEILATERRLVDVSARVDELSAEFGTVKNAVSKRTSLLERERMLSPAEKAELSRVNEFLNLRAEIDELNSALLRLKDTLGNVKKDIAELQSRRDDLLREIDNAPIGDYPLPSRLRELFPLSTLRSLKRDYTIDGKFYGGDEFANYLLSDFDGGIKVLQNAKKCILGPQQIIHILFKLEDEAQRRAFADALNRKGFFLKGQRAALRDALNNLPFVKRELPGYITRGLTDIPGESISRRNARGMRVLMAYVVALLLGGPTANVVRDNVSKRYNLDRAVATNVRSVEESLTKGVSEEFSSLSGRTPSSDYVIGSANGSLKGLKEYTKLDVAEFLKKSSQSEIDTVLRKSGVSDASIAGVAAATHSFPDEIKKYVKYFFSGGTPYYFVDQAQFYKDYGLDPKTADVNLLEFSDMAESKVAGIDDVKALFNELQTALKDVSLQEIADAYKQAQDAGIFPSGIDPMEIARLVKSGDLRAVLDLVENGGNDIVADASNPRPILMEVGEADPEGSVVKKVIDGEWSASWIIPLNIMKYVIMLVPGFLILEAIFPQLRRKGEKASILRFVEWIWSVASGKKQEGADKYESFGDIQGLKPGNDQESAETVIKKLEGSGSAFDEACLTDEAKGILDDFRREFGVFYYGALKELSNGSFKKGEGYEAFQLLVGHVYRVMRARAYNTVAGLSGGPFKPIAEGAIGKSKSALEKATKAAEEAGKRFRDASAKAQEAREGLDEAQNSLVSFRRLPASKDRQYDRDSRIADLQSSVRRAERIQTAAEAIETSTGAEKAIADQALTAVSKAAENERNTTFARRFDFVAKDANQADDFLYPFLTSIGNFKPDALSSLKSFVNGRFSQNFSSEGRQILVGGIDQYISLKKLAGDLRLKNFWEKMKQARFAGADAELARVNQRIETDGNWVRADNKFTGRAKFLMITAVLLGVAGVTTAVLKKILKKPDAPSVPSSVQTSLTSGTVQAQGNSRNRDVLSPAGVGASARLGGKEAVATREMAARSKILANLKTSLKLSANPEEDVVLEAQAKQGWRRLHSNQKNIHVTKFKNIIFRNIPAFSDKKNVDDYVDNYVKNVLEK